MYILSVFTDSKIASATIREEAPKKRKLAPVTFQKVTITTRMLLASANAFLLSANAATPLR
jgi:hypothetical protein